MPRPTIVRSSRSLLQARRSACRAGSDMCGDRFIPSRVNMKMDLCRRALLSDQKSAIRTFNDDNTAAGAAAVTTASAIADARKKEFNRFLLSTLCDVPMDRLDDNAQLKSIFQFSSSEPQVARNVTSGGMPVTDPFAMDVLRAYDTRSLKQSVTSVKTQSLNPVPDQAMRILDAPNLDTDINLSLMSWSADNILALALGRQVYLYNARTRDVRMMTDVLVADTVSEEVSCVKWCNMAGKTHYLAVATETAVHIYNSRTSTIFRSFTGTGCRAASMAWNAVKGWLTVGFYNGKIFNIDFGSDGNAISLYEFHQQEVCCLAWNESGTRLASGSDDTMVCLWDADEIKSHKQPLALFVQRPRFVFKGHTASVKAIAWCPYDKNVLATGGGVDDGTIKVWNALSGNTISTTNTGSDAVTSLMWFDSVLFSGHGEDVSVWLSRSMRKVQSLSRQLQGCVLCMEMSPDRSSMAALCEDERLLFWKVDERKLGPQQRQNCKVLSGRELNPFGFPTIR
jgi:cell division cycle protein 20 (cofactor of APC complex)